MRMNAPPCAYHKQWWLVIVLITAIAQIEVVLAVEQYQAGVNYYHYQNCKGPDYRYGNLGPHMFPDHPVEISHIGPGMAVISGNPNCMEYAYRGCPAETSLSYFNHHGALICETTARPVPSGASVSKNVGSASLCVGNSVTLGLGNKLLIQSALELRSPGGLQLSRYYNSDPAVYASYGDGSTAGIRTITNGKGYSTDVSETVLNGVPMPAQITGPSCSAC